MRLSFAHTHTHSQTHLWNTLIRRTHSKFFTEINSSPRSTVATALISSHRLNVAEPRRALVSSSPRRRRRRSEFVSFESSEWVFLLCASASELACMSAPHSALVARVCEQCKQCVALSLPVLTHSLAAMVPGIGSAPQGSQGGLPPFGFVVGFLFFGHAGKNVNQKLCA